MTGAPLLALALVLPAGDPSPLAAVDDFTYVLQGKKGEPLDLAAVAASPFDLCIVDATRDGTDPFTPAEIAALRSPAEPNRIRLAYLSIGEAEDYRWYFDHVSPSLIAASNPDWKGNFKVRYWEPEWKEVIVTGNAAVGASYLDRIVDQGFDGVYLDVVDAFEFFGPAENGGEDVKRDAAREMVEFVQEIAFHARVTRGKADFLVVPQNGANVLLPEWYPADTLGSGDPGTPSEMAAAMQAAYFATVDGIGVEDVFFYGKKKHDNPLKPQDDLLAALEAWTAAGLPVFSVEYLGKKKRVKTLYEVLAPAHGFVPYATVRSLKKVRVHAAFPPD